MNFNDILNSQINEALDLKQDKKYFDLLIKSAPKLLKVLQFGESYPSVIELKKQLNIITSQEVVPFLQKAEYSFSNYEQDVIEKLTGNSSNNYFCFFNKTKIDNTTSIEVIKDEINNASKINLTALIEICDSIIGLNKLFAFIGKHMASVKDIKELKDFYKARTNIVYTSKTGEQYTVDYNNNQLNFYVNSKRIFYIHNYMNNKEALYDEKTGQRYELSHADLSLYSKMISPSTLKLAEDVLKLLKTKLFFNDAKDIKYKSAVAKQVLMSNNIDLFNFDAKDARYIFIEAIKDTFRQNHDRNIIFNNFDIKCEKDSDLNYVLKVNIIAKLNPFQ